MTVGQEAGEGRIRDSGDSGVGIASASVAEVGLATEVDLTPGPSPARGGSR